jgi:hypothetical protein
MHRYFGDSKDIFNRDAPYTDFAGYPVNLKAEYRISGQISGAGWIIEIWPNIDSTFYCLVKY